jgi:hypothetical protein
MAASDLDKLRDAAIEALRASNNSVNKAAPTLARALMDNAKRPLLIALVADYLSRLSSPSSETKLPRIAHPKPAARRREGKHRRSSLLRTPTDAQKAGAIAAGQAVAAEIFNRKIRGYGPLGKLRVHELRAIAENLANTAGDFLQRGYDDAVDAIAIRRLNDYCVAADPHGEVEKVIPLKIAVQYYNDARIKAVEVIRDGSAKVASDLIAAARKPSEIEGDARS